MSGRYITLSIAAAVAVTGAQAAAVPVTGSGALQPMSPWSWAQDGPARSV
jgi:hypothetical protein